MLLDSSCMLVLTIVALQVVAITVYFLLSVAFYAFFAAFLGKDIYEYIAIGVYSFLVNIMLAGFLVTLAQFLFHICILLSLTFLPLNVRHFLY